jgi:hypothetical protein
MATTAQIDANRLNATASTGPRTAEGKSASSRNATTFGLFSTRNVVRKGEEDQYEAFVEAFRQDLAPAGAPEHALAAEITSAAAPTGASRLPPAVLHPTRISSSNSR